MGVLNGSTAQMAESIPSTKSPPKTALPLVVALVHVAVVLSAVAVYLLWNNNLKENGNWRVTKLELEIPAMGSLSYFAGPQALARGHLNLGAWHGFQEVIYRNPVEIKDLKLRFLLGPNGYLSIIYGKSEREFRGIRLSANPEFCNATFTAESEGEFLQKSPIPLAPLQSVKWHTCHLWLEGQIPHLELDGQPVEFSDAPLSAFTALGFRGCETQALVDNVVATEENGTVFRDTFFSTRHWLPATLVALGVVLFADLLALLLTRRCGVPLKHLMFGMLYLGLLTGIALFAVFCVVFLTQHKYPTAGSIPASQIKADSQRDEEHLRQQLEPYPQEPAPGTIRVVFLGTSQTRGGNPTKSSQAFVARTMEWLNTNAPKGFQYDCINAGISGGDSNRLVDLYEELLLPLHPRLVIINLGNNDQSAPVLAANLDRIINMSEERHVKALILLEPNSIERCPGDLPNHPAMREVARKRRVPCVELHQYLKDRWDTGFIWWDFVHLTSHGHRLIAECIEESLVQYDSVLQLGLESKQQ